MIVRLFRPTALMVFRLSVGALTVRLRPRAPGRVLHGELLTEPIGSKCRYPGADTAGTDTRTRNERKSTAIGRGDPPSVTRAQVPCHEAPTPNSKSAPRHPHKVPRHDTGTYVNPIPCDPVGHSGIRDIPPNGSLGRPAAARACRTLGTGEPTAIGVYRSPRKRRHHCSNSESAGKPAFLSNPGLRLAISFQR